MTTKAALSIADYLALEDPPGVRYELWEGDLLVAPSAANFHNRLGRRIAGALERHADTSRAGEVINETDIRIGPATVLRLDAAFIVAARWRPEYDDMVPIPIVPDLAFEILSPSDQPGAVLRKAAAYLRAGVTAVWLLDPKRRTLRRCDNAHSEGEVLAAIVEPELLPGFSLSLDELVSPQL